MNKYKKQLIGLDRYIKEFKTQQEQDLFIENNKHKYTITEVIINNGFCLEFKKLRCL